VENAVCGKLVVSATVAVLFFIVSLPVLKVNFLKLGLPAGTIVYQFPYFRKSSKL